MGAITIKTNNQFRFLVNGYDLTEKQRKEFSQYDEKELDAAYFFEYKGQLYDVADFTKIEQGDTDFSEWDAVLGTSYFDGVLIKMSGCSEKVKVGRFYQ